MGAYRGLLYKEWIKVRWVLLVLSLISIGVLVELLLSTRSMFEFVDPVKVWESAIQKQMIFYGGIRYLPLVAGVLLALVQFVPEARKRRLRLLFHLPVDHTHALYLMIAAGLAGTLLVIAVNGLGLLLVVPAYYPAEIVHSALVTALPWFLGGLLAYLATVLVVVEPVWWRRVVYAGMAYVLAQLFYEGRGTQTYAHAWPRYALLAALFAVAPLLPAFRFKRGIDR